MLFIFHASIFFLLLSVGALECALQPWTWCYSKKFTTNALKDTEQAFAKTDLAPFTQLVFSWNAHKPLIGGFSFFVRVQYADTHQWSNWHHMAEWSASGGKTMYGRHKDGLEQCYVRLEIPKKRFSDGFQIKVERFNGADTALIKKFNVCVSNFTLFSAEKDSDYGALPAVHIKDVPATSQHLVGHPCGPDICSPVALCNLAHYLTGKILDPAIFADAVFDPGLNIYGSWGCNVAHAFHATEGKVFFRMQRLHDFRTLYEYLCKDIPVVVSVRGSLTGAPKTYPGGHLLTVVGFDPKDNVVICHDSAVWILEEVVKRYRLDEFLKAWGNSHRLAYIADVV